METSNIKNTMYGTLSNESRIGGRKENQDYFGFTETENGLLVVVCDGMGGSNGGKVASRLATETMLNEFESNGIANKAELLINIIKKANKVVFDSANANPNLQGMGTTATALYIDGNSAVVAHVGDSRIYQIRKGKKIFRTFDHSMVFELVKRGTISEEQARLSAESNVILRALGTKAEIKIEVSQELPYLKGDRFLLCSDGISGSITENELIRLVSKRKNVEITNKTLADKIDAVGVEKGGGHDNLTSSIIQLEKNSKVKTTDKSRVLLLIISILFILIIALTFWFFTQKSRVSKQSQDDNTQTSILIKDSMLKDANKLYYYMKQTVPKSTNNCI